MEIKTLLRSFDACQETVDWVGERDLKTAWADCERADWMLWFFGMMAGKKGWPSRQEVVLTAIKCGRLSLTHAGKYEKKLAKVFDDAERYMNDPIPKNESAVWSAVWSAAWSAAHKTMCNIIRERLKVPINEG